MHLPIYSIQLQIKHLFGATKKQKKKKHNKKYCFFFDVVFIYFFFLLDLTSVEMIITIINA